MKTNEHLTDEFITIVSQIRGILDKINRKIYDLEDNFNPDSLTQTDINTLLKIRFDLVQASSSIDDRLGGWE